ncbi:MAG: glucosyltransferase domain-containing protein [Oscillospiraceae bacterium]
MSLKNQHRFNRATYFALFAVLFGLIFARYCYFGFEYFYQMDDYIQYHNYKAFNPDLWGLISSLGMLSNRPLAGLCDLFIWSNFYNCMIVAVGIISAMYAASALLLHRVFSKHFGTGFLFFVIYALLPLGFEGAYWVSASSRIIVGLFFASLALFFFEGWCEKGKAHRLLLFVGLQLIAFCFYEQVVLFSGAATLIIMLLNLKSRNRRALWGFLMFLNAAIYFALTKLAPTGVYSGRTTLILPWQAGYMELCFLPAGAQMLESFISGGFATCGKGLVRGFEIIFSQPNILFILVILLLCAAFLLIGRKTKREKIRFLPALFSGLFLTLAPLLLFFVLKDPWFGVRNALCSFCGLALMADALLGLILRRFSKAPKIEAWIATVLALLCCVAAVSELHDYRETTLADKQIASAAGQALENEDFSDHRPILLLNVDASYVKNANFYFHDHGYGVTGSDWAMTGAVRALSGRGKIPMLTPISKYRSFAIPKDNSKMFFYSQGEFVPVSPEETKDGWRLKDSGGTILGELLFSQGSANLRVK